DEYTPVEPPGSGRAAPMPPIEPVIEPILQIGEPAPEAVPAPEPAALVGAATGNGDRLASEEPAASDAALALPEGLEDDRADLVPGDRVVLVIDDSEEMARKVVEVGHEGSFKVLLSLRGEAGLALAHE